MCVVWGGGEGGRNPLTCLNDGDEATLTTGHDRKNERPTGHNKDSQNYAHVIGDCCVVINVRSTSVARTMEGHGCQTVITHPSSCPLHHKR